MLLVPMKHKKQRLRWEEKIKSVDTSQYAFNRCSHGGYMDSILKGQWKKQKQLNNGRHLFFRCKAYLSYLFLPVNLNQLIDEMKKVKGMLFEHLYLLSLDHFQALYAQILNDRAQYYLQECSKFWALGSKTLFIAPILKWREKTYSNDPNVTSFYAPNHFFQLSHY